MTAALGRPKKQLDDFYQKSSIGKILSSHLSCQMCKYRQAYRDDRVSCMSWVVVDHVALESSLFEDLLRPQSPED